MSNVNIFSRFSQKKSFLGVMTQSYAFLHLRLCLRHVWHFNTKSVLCCVIPDQKNYLSLVIVSSWPQNDLYESLITFRFWGMSIWLWFNLWVWGHSRLLIGRDNWSILLFLGGIAIGEWGHPLLIPCINFIICVSLVMVDLIMSKRLSAPFFSHCVNV